MALGNRFISVTASFCIFSSFLICVLLIFHHDDDDDDNDEDDDDDNDNKKMVMMMMILIVIRSLFLESCWQVEHRCTVTVTC